MVFSVLQKQFLAKALAVGASAAHFHRILLVLALSASTFASAQELQPIPPQAPAQAPAATAEPQSPPPTPAPDAAPPPTTAAPAQAPAEAAPPATPVPSPAAASPIVQPASASKPDDARELSRELSEDQLRQQLVGKPLMLRGGYLGDSLSFNEHGSPVGHPAVGSYTLSAVEIEKVHLTKHKVELIGARYGLHFLGALPYDDPAKTMDRVKITPKKKVLKITIDREQVVKPRKEKEKKSKSAPAPKAAGPATALSNASPDSPETAPSTSAATPAAAPAPTEADQAKAAADETKADIAATPDAERPADAASQTTTTSQSHANQVLRDALDRIFAPGLDERMMSQIPQFWQLYYKAQAAGVDYRPQDPNVLRSSAVDQQAKLTSPINPDSNDFAQENGIAGRALYRVVVGADGKPGEIAVVRPIGFGLDENAVAAIGKASFQPAMKGGKPAAETLDLAVVFRIYSKRTSVAAKTPADNSTAVAQPAKPGPYTVRQQPQQPQQSQ